MTILTIITNVNDHTVYLKEPIKNFQFVKLVSCSLYNSWINLKEKGKITLTENEAEAGKKILEIPPGHHTPESMLYFFKNLSYFSQNNSPQGILALPNLENKTITGITPNFLELFDVNPRIGADLVIKKFKTPHNYFIHCDLIFLQNFQSAGSLMKKSITFLHRMRSFVTPRQEIIIYIVSPFLSKMKMVICLTLKVFL